MTSFRDRFLTRRTAEAMMSPLGIVLAGAGAALAIVGGLPVVAAAGVGAAAWGARVLAGMPRSAPRERVEPAALSEPWRGYVTSAQDAKRRFDKVVASVPVGPLRSRLDQLSARLDDGIDESWRIARRGDEVAGAVRQIDTGAAERELVELRARADPGSPATAGTIAALEAQLASAHRLESLAQRSRDRLRLLDARFDELVARAVEVSVGAGDTEGLGADVDGLVSELEALRVALEETDQVARARAARVSLLRSNVVVATGTALSRLTGLARVSVFAIVIGQTALADTYRIGNETPNIVYELLVGGVLSATLVPLFTSFIEREDGESTNAVITVSLAALAALTTVAVIAAPWIFRLYTLDPSSDVDPDQLHRVGTLLTRVFLVQIFFYGATALANAYLNAQRRFFAAAWSPILPNLIIIVTLLSLPDPSAAEWDLGDVLTDDRLRWTLGLGATAGIAAMAVVLIPAVRAAGLRYRPVFDLRHPAIRRLVRLSGWTLGYVAANQVVIAVVRNLADPGSGDAAAYFDAYTLLVLPHGLLAMSIATTFSPDMARAVERRDRRSFVDQTSLGVRLIALLTLPAGVLLFVLRRPVVGALLQHGEYTPADALNTSRALAGFALGLAGFSVYLFVLRGFYAHQDTRTPFVVNAVECLLNIVLALLLVDRYGILGLGAAFAIAYVVSAVWALQVLTYKVATFPLRAVLASVGRMLLAAVLAGEVTWFVARAVGDDAGWAAVARIATAATMGLIAYVAVLAALRAPELDAARRRLTRRGPGSVATVGR